MSSRTQATLLDRLREAADPLAWDEFFERYWRLVYAMARQRGCSEHSAEEVVQETMLAVFRQRQVFRYDPARGRFRDWLGAVVRNVISQRHRRADLLAQAHAAASAENDPLEQVAGAAETPDEVWDQAFEQTLLASLLDVIRHEVAPETFQAFELTFLHDLPAATAASLTGLSRNAVYLARRRVLDRLRALGASYADDGQLGSQLRESLNHLPRHEIQRAVSERVERTLDEERTP